MTWRGFLAGFRMLLAGAATGAALMLLVLLISAGIWALVRG